jgi:DNA-binding response OmpR family regulator
VVLDRDTLFRECWGGAHYPNSRTLDQHISKLRKKVEPDSKDPTIIHTVRGVGYRYDG